MKIDPILLSTISDLFVNLSAGWFAAAFIVPVTSKRPRKVNVGVLTMNILWGTVFLIGAVWFKQIIAP